jgi:hypothetical protein
MLLCGHCEGVFCSKNERFCHRFLGAAGRELFIQFSPIHRYLFFKVKYNFYMNEIILQQVKFARPCNGLGAIGHGKPGEDVFDMALGRVETDHQAVSDLLIG